VAEPIEVVDGTKTIEKCVCSNTVPIIVLKIRDRFPRNEL